MSLCIEEEYKKLKEEVKSMSSFTNWYDKGVGEYVHKRYEEAISSFTTALSRKSDDDSRAYALQFRGGNYVKIGKFDEALADYKESIKYRWGNPRPHYSMANIYLRQDHLDIDKAEEGIEILKGLLNEGKLGGGEKAFAEYRIKELEMKVKEAKK